MAIAISFPGGHINTTDEYQAILNKLNDADASNEVTTSGTTTSATYTAALTGAGVCGMAFTSPSNGNIIIYYEAQLSNSGAGFSLMSFQLRTGNVVGSGTIVQDASDDETLQNS